MLRWPESRRSRPHPLGDWWSGLPPLHHLQCVFLSLRARPTAHPAAQESRSHL